MYFLVLLPPEFFLLRKTLPNSFNGPGNPSLNLCFGDSQIIRASIFLVYVVGEAEKKIDTIRDTDTDTFGIEYC